MTLESHGSAEYLVNEAGLTTGVTVRFDKPINMLPGDKLELTMTIADPSKIRALHEGQ